MTKRERYSLAQFLDMLVPLKGASHRDVIAYAVTVPMRYAKVQARLTNGEVTQLSNAQQFLGWAGYGTNPTLLLNCGDRNVVINTAGTDEASPEVFIAPDGGQISAASVATH